MESSMVLHENLSQGGCICHIKTTTILQQVDLSSLVTGQGSDGEISMSTRDEVLVRLGLITSLLEMNHCSKLKEVHQALLVSDIFENLHSLFSSNDQLVAYCASKCLEVHLQKLARNDKHLAKDLLRQAFMAILNPRDTFDENNESPVINRTIFTLDLLTNSMRGGSTRSESAKEDTSILPCMVTSSAAEDGGNRSTSQSRDEPSIDFTHWYHNVIPDQNILELCATFSSQFGLISDQHCSISSNQPSWLQSVEIRSKHKICHAFLRLLYSYTKVQSKKDPQIMLSFTQSTLPHLQAMLMSYCQESVANLKLVLSILILSVKACVKACESVKQLGKVESCNRSVREALCDSWRRLEADICEGDWLEKIPYHGGHVGFGGSFLTSEKEPSDSSDEYSRGDRILLRKLASLVIMGSELEAVSSGTMSNYGFRHIDHISHFIVSKLKCASTCKEETMTPGGWIFEIFGDQDDALIGIMLSLLKISLSSKSRLRNKSCKSSKSVSPGEDEIPGESNNQCILDAHHVFICFLGHMTWDHSILLDLLISMETDFLEYLIRYLRLVATDWEGFVRVQRLRRKKDEDVPLMVSSDADSDDDDGSHSNIGSDDDGCGVDNELEDEIIDSAKGESYQDFGDNENVGSDNEIAASEQNEELYQKTEQSSKWSEDFHYKRKCLQIEKMQGETATKVQKTDREGLHDIAIATVHVKEVPCSDLTKQEKNNSFIQSTASLGCLDDTMTILIRLRLAIDRLDEKGLFPFSVTPLIRLLVQVEALYEDV